MDLSWDEVFGDLDARTLSEEERFDWIQRKIAKAVGDRGFTAFGGPEEARLSLAAAEETYVRGIWTATIHCCHATCEQELAGAIVLWNLLSTENHSKRLERMGLGGAISLAEELKMLPPDLIADLRRLSELRRPYGHWKEGKHEGRLFWRTHALAKETDNYDHEQLVGRLLVRDATEAMQTAIKLLYGNYALGG